MKPKLIINADDLGLVPEVNKAIFEAHKEGFLTHASFMANTVYFEETIQEIKEKNSLKIGVHVNLTCGLSLSKAKSISNKYGEQGLNFIKILFMKKDKQTLQEIETEIEAQILRIKNEGVFITHIDGHEHIHIIPSINKIVKKLAEKHKISRVREINESFYAGIKYHGKKFNLSNAIKWLVLKGLSLFNKRDNKIGFHSIFSTCMVSEDTLFNYLEHEKKYKTVEIMLHPSYDVTSKHFTGLDTRFIEFLKSDYRKQEFALCFNKKFKDYNLA